VLLCLSLKTQHTHTHTTTTQKFPAFCVFVAADKQTNKQQRTQTDGKLLSSAQTRTSKRAANATENGEERLQTNKTSNKQHTQSKAKMCGVPHTTRRKQTQKTTQTETETPHKTHKKCRCKGLLSGELHKRKQQTRTKQTCFASSACAVKQTNKSKQSDGLWVVGPSRVWEFYCCDGQTNKQKRHNKQNKQTPMLDLR